MAALLRALPGLEAFEFVGDLFPPVGDPAAVEWFAAATLQQYGFWYEVDGGYGGPMIATIDGVQRKGSDYLWAQYLRWHRRGAVASWHRRGRPLSVRPSGGPAPSRRRRGSVPRPE